MTIIWAVLIIGFLIFTHELGHYYAARWTGVIVQEFAIGFGHKIFARKKGDTLYSLRIFPIGGFVKLAGMDPNDDYYRSESGFAAQSLPKRCFIMLAGSLVHLILTIFLFFIIAFVVGLPVDYVDKGEIGEVLANGPAAKAGIVPGDIITSVNGVSTDSWQAVAQEIHQYPNQEVTFIIQRGTSTQTLKIITDVNTDNHGIIGISPALKLERMSFFAAIKFAPLQTWDLFKAMMNGLWTLVSGRAGGDGLVGPVGLAQMIGGAVRSGAFYIMQLTAVLSLNFAIINLLPLPALDGGRIMMLGVEAIRRKPLDPEKEGMFHFVGFVLLIGLTVYVTFKDILRFGG